MHPLPSCFERKSALTTTHSSHNHKHTQAHTNSNKHKRAQTHTPSLISKRTLISFYWPPFLRLSRHPRHRVFCHRLFPPTRQPLPLESPVSLYFCPLKSFSSSSFCWVSLLRFRLRFLLHRRRGMRVLEAPSTRASTSIDQNRCRRFDRYSETPEGQEDKIRGWFVAIYYLLRPVIDNCSHYCSLCDKLIHMCRRTVQYAP